MCGAQSDNVEDISRTQNAKESSSTKKTHTHTHPSLLGDLMRPTLPPQSHGGRLCAAARSAFVLNPHLWLSGLAIRAFGAFWASSFLFLLLLVQTSRVPTNLWSRVCIYHVSPSAQKGLEINRQSKRRPAKRYPRRGSKIYILVGEYSWNTIYSVMAGVLWRYWERCYAAIVHIASMFGCIHFIPEIELSPNTDLNCWGSLQASLGLLIWMPRGLTF